MTTGRSAFLALLQDEGVTHLFGNPGTTELPIMSALGEHPELTYVLGLAEGVVVAMADGYARASGRLAACNVHVAPGLGNAMGSLWSAHWVGSPLIVTAGQQEQGFGLTEPLLYDSLVPMAAPASKWAVEVNRVQDLPRILRRAAKVATTPPTGPVFISLPGDILNESAELDLGRRSRVARAVRPADDLLEEIAGRLLAAERPVIVAGHEVATADALAEAAALAELLGAPVWQQTVPCGAHFPSEHRAFVGSLPRVQARVRETLTAHDLLIALGGDVLRMSVPGDGEPLPAHMPVVQIGSDDWELAKNDPVEIALRAELKATLAALNSALERRRSPEAARAAERRLEAVAAEGWSAKREGAVATAREVAGRTPIHPDHLMLQIAETLPLDGIVVEEGLMSSRALYSLLPYRDAMGFHGLASGGIGFAVAGAVGVQLAQPSRPVLAVVGDGSAMYNIQALWSAAHVGAPLTWVICNNRSYRILKERLVAYQGSMPGNRGFVGMDFHDPPIDFAALAASMGVEGHRITEPDEVRPALEAALAREAPVLLDVEVDDGF